MSFYLDMEDIMGYNRDDLIYLIRKIAGLEMKI